MFSYVKFENHHIDEVEALVEKFFLPLVFRHACTREEIKPEFVELLPILGKNFATEFVNKHTIVCTNEKNNVVGALLSSYLGQEEFMYHAFHKWESYLKLPIKHDMPAKKCAILKTDLYKDVKIFEKNESGKVLYLKHGIVHPEYRRLNIAHRMLAASIDHFCCDDDLLVTESFMERKDLTDANIQERNGFTVLSTVESADSILRLLVRRVKSN